MVKFLVEALWFIIKALRFLLGLSIFGASWPHQGYEGLVSDRLCAIKAQVKATNYSLLC